MASWHGAPVAMCTFLCPAEGLLLCTVGPTARGMAAPWSPTLEAWWGGAEVSSVGLLDHWVLAQECTQTCTVIECKGTEDLCICVWAISSNGLKEAELL